MAGEKIKTEKVFLSLGSNLGDSLENLMQAIFILQEKGILIKAISSVYRTKAVGYTEQDDFLNLVLCGETELTVWESLNACLDTENKLGRVRTIRWGPRIIDIDLLFFGEQEINTERLQLPHPRLKERAFVLVPLQEIDIALFKRLEVDIPSQKVDLLIPCSDVKIMLKEKGLLMDED